MIWIPFLIIILVLLIILPKFASKKFMDGFPVEPQPEDPEEIYSPGDERRGRYSRYKQTPTERMNFRRKPTRLIRS